MTDTQKFLALSSMAAKVFVLLYLSLNLVGFIIFNIYRGIVFLWEHYGMLITLEVTSAVLTALFTIAVITNAKDKILAEAAKCVIGK